MLMIFRFLYLYLSKSVRNDGIVLGVIRSATLFERTVNRLFVILVYDVNRKRVVKVLKKCRQYLNWVQNSVLEGEISEANFRKLKMELERIIRTDEDSVIFYCLRTTKYSFREIMGLKKGGDENII